MGFTKTKLQALKVPTGSQGAGKLFGDFLGRMKHYNETRDFPALKGPSYLGVHLRFGTVSIRKMVSDVGRRRESQSEKFDAQGWVKTTLCPSFSTTKRVR